MSTHASADGETVQLCCTRCDASLGQTKNLWFPADESHVYTEDDEVEWNVKIGIEVRRVADDGIDTGFGGCDLVAVSCKSCDTLFGRHCTEVFGKKKKFHFEGITFFRTSKTYLVADETGASVPFQVLRNDGAIALVPGTHKSGTSQRASSRSRRNSRTPARQSMPRASSVLNVASGSAEPGSRVSLGDVVVETAHHGASLNELGSRVTAIDMRISTQEQRFLRQEENIEKLDSYLADRDGNTDADTSTLRIAIEEHEARLANLNSKVDAVVDQSNQIAELRASLDTMQALLTSRDEQGAAMELTALQNENRMLREQIVALASGNNVLGKRKRFEDGLIQDPKRVRSTYPDVPNNNGFSAVNALNALAGAAAAVGDDSIEFANDDADDAYVTSETEDSEEEYVYDEIVPVSKRQAAKNLAKGIPNPPQTLHARALTSQSSTPYRRRPGFYKKNRLPPGSLPVKNPTPRNTKYACEICSHGGYTILYCIECHKCYHSKCLEIEGNAKDVKEWTCPNCQTKQANTKPPKESEAERRARNKGHAKAVLQTKTPSKKVMVNAEEATPTEAQEADTAGSGHVKKRKTTEQIIADALNGEPIDPELEDATEDIDIGDVTMANSEGEDRLAAVIRDVNPQNEIDEQERELEERIRLATQQLDENTVEGDAATV